MKKQCANYGYGIKYQLNCSSNNLNTAYGFGYLTNKGHTHGFQNNSWVFKNTTQQLINNKMEDKNNNNKTDLVFIYINIGLAFNIAALILFFYGYV